MTFLNLIPAPVYAGLLAAACIVVGIQEVRISGLQVELAEARTEAAEERAEREKAAREYVEETGRIRDEHAAQQQELENAWQTERTAFEHRRAADARQLDRLRVQIAAFTTPRPTPGGGAGPAPDLDQDNRLTTLGSLFEESLGLLVEGRAVIEQRDAEVKRLVDQVALDRAACLKPRLGAAGLN